MGINSYSLEQFPKNKNIKNLSDEQKSLRVNIKRCKNVFTCVKCGREQPIHEFYIADINTGRRRKNCRDCQMKAAGVIEIGKIRFAEKIFNKGFRRCSVCKCIKPITEFKMNKTQTNGISSNCYECAHKLHQSFYFSQKEKIGKSFIKEYGKRRGITVFDDRTFKQLKKEIVGSRKPKYFLDDKSFVTVTDFGNYVQNKYGISKETVLNRIQKGFSEKECIISKNEVRSKAHTKGSVKVTDTVTGEIFEFNNTADEKLNKMFSKSAITKGIKTGEKTKVTKLSKYKNPCIITRV